MKKDLPFYISDLDGTLLQPDARLSDYARQSLREMLENGLQFTVASARSIHSIREILGDMPLQIPVIGTNGAFVSDFKTGEHIHIASISHDIIHSLMEDILVVGSPFLSTFNGLADKLYYQQIDNQGFDWYVRDRINLNDSRLTKTDSLFRHLKEFTVSMTVIHKEEVLRDLQYLLESRYAGYIQTYLFENFYDPKWYWLSVHDVRANKGEAIRHLLKNYKLEEHMLTVFGDHLNDLDMFKLAPRAFAMKESHKGLVPYAVKVIGSNSDDDVIRLIKEENLHLYS